jgi:hypothetical protein
MKSLFALALLLFCTPSHADTPIQHYVFFAHERERIHETSFLETPAFAGAQLKYTWRELEPERDHYDFSALQKDWEFLKSKGKRLFVQLQETSFDAKNRLVPDYLLQDPQFHGGADKQYNIENDDESKAEIGGWVARRWDAAVRTRFHKLLFALGKAFDGKIEGINLPETAVEFGMSGKLFPKGFTPAIYRDATLLNMTALKKAFPKSVVMQYANFMPSEWLPENNKGYLNSVYAHAKRLKIGVGGPDLMPYKPGQMKHAYPRIRAHFGAAPTGVAVQDGNYSHKNPKTGKPITLNEIVGFAKGYLKVNYIFWCTEEPYYSEKLIPFLTPSP